MCNNRAGFIKSTEITKICYEISEKMFIINNYNYICRHGYNPRL